MKFGGRRRRRDPELAPDEIFLDSSNLPDFDQSRLEGRLERPISQKTFAGVAVVVGLMFIALVAQAANLEVIKGSTYAQQSEKNRLRPGILFAERGAILDRNGVPLVSNEATADGSVQRVYKTPGFSHLLGYVSYPRKDSSGHYYNTDITGLAGIEAAFNSTLAGINGTLLVEENALGKTTSEGTVKPPVNGQNLTLSIDSRAQDAFYHAISQLADKIPFQGGSGILLDVNTGEIRALVSYPEYDPNVLSSGGPSDVIASYASDTRQPYLDRAVTGLYTPGSIVKPIEASGALTDGIITPEYTINDPGYLSIPNPYDASHPNIFKDWKAIGVEDLRKAIAFSSDVYFYTVGGGYGSQKGLGIERLKYWYQTFGFTKPTGVELPREASGFVPDPAWKLKTYKQQWNIGDTYHTAIGQYAMQVTPIEAARAIAAIANGGKLIKPTVLANQSPQGESIAVSPAALQVVREGMRQGALEGTSIGLSDLSFVHIAGKTGTAQLGLHNEYYNSWAVGFFPYENPKYVYVVVMEHGPSGNALGGIYAVHQALSELHSTAPEYFQ
ncbi:MAG: penicillin-binding protein 2, penicillin-binding protein 2 [Parcubacteria group bacterium]|nr:penicillin-binding protein 2, penicillin-binding protein 2 [Parcubacteria group bacterium]